MNCDIDFAIWCAKRCLHLWNAPDEVKDWFKDPRPETAEAVWAAALAAAEAAYAAEAEDAAWAAANAANAVEAEDEAWEAEDDAAKYAAKEAAGAAAKAARALNTTVTELRFEFVKTWTDDELAKTEEDWIEAATVEILDRE